MTTATRQQFISVAKNLFAQKGFYGTSIAAIARELGLTKQALLHHFGSKEKLYGEVLRELSKVLLLASESVVSEGYGPAERLEELVLLQYRSQMADQVFLVQGHGQLEKGFDTDVLKLDLVALDVDRARFAFWIPVGRPLFTPDIGGLVLADHHSVRVFKIHVGHGYPFFLGRGFYMLLVDLCDRCQ